MHTVPAIEVANPVRPMNLGPQDLGVQPGCAGVVELDVALTIGGAAELAWLGAQDEAKAVAADTAEQQHQFVPGLFRQSFASVLGGLA
jgi:hypothetical protein